MKRSDYYQLINIVIICIICVFIGLALSISIGVNTHKPNKEQCKHLKANKGLLWMDSILNSNDTIIRYFDNGSRLEFYPNPYNNLTKK